MQGKLVIAKGHLDKLRSAAFFEGVTITSEPITVGGDTHVEVSCRTLNDAFKCGFKMAEVDGTEYAAVMKLKKAKEDAKAAKATAGTKPATKK